MPDVVDAPAKLTRSLRITGVRADGYHLIDAEMVSVDLVDTLIFSEGDGLALVDAGPDVPLDRTNLVCRALALVGRTAHVEVIKRIPSGAGLGGGSSDAAAVLRWAGLSDVSGAASLGADVPFCVTGGRAQVRGIGEGLTALAFEGAHVHPAHAHAALLDGRRLPSVGRARRTYRSGSERSRARRARRRPRAGRAGGIASATPPERRPPWQAAAAPGSSRATSPARAASWCGPCQHQGMPEPVVLYEERDDLAVITLNRPERLNTLTDQLVQGVADGIDAATASADVRAIVLRGAGRATTAGYDLQGDPGATPVGPPDPEYGSWSSPYDAPRVEHRAGAWDPVRDLQFMGNNVRRFMKIWECPKPVIGEIHGFAIGGATDLVLCCDQLFMAEDAIIGYAPSRIYGTPTTMLWVHRIGLEHAKQFLLTGTAIDAPTALRIGLVSEVHPAGELSGRVEAHARRFANIPANQLALNKLLINQAFDNMGLRTTQLLGTLFDGITRHTEEARRWEESIREQGFRQVIKDRDDPWGDYGSAP